MKDIFEIERDSGGGTPQLSKLGTIMGTHKVVAPCCSVNKLVAS